MERVGRVRQMVECLAGILTGYVMRFAIRDLLWLTAVVGLSVGLYAKHEQYRKVATAACSLESAFDALAEYAAEEEGWTIKKRTSGFRIYRPGDEIGRPSFSCAWQYPRPNLNSLESGDKEWSPKAIIHDREGSN